MSVEQLTLLDAPETLSPRLAWMREHDVKTRELLTDGQEDELTGNSGPLWAAWHGDEPTTIVTRSRAQMLARYVLATTEQGAVDRLAERNGWKLWNE